MREMREKKGERSRERQRERERERERGSDLCISCCFTLLFFCPPGREKKAKNDSRIIDFFVSQRHKRKSTKKQIKPSNGI